MLPLRIEARSRDGLRVKKSKAMFGGDLVQLHLTYACRLQVGDQAILSPCKGNTVGLFDFIFETVLFDGLQQRHLGGRILPPSVMEGMVDADLKLLGDEQTLVHRCSVGVKVHAELLTAGDAVAKTLDVEDDRVEVVLVLDQAR